MDENTRYYGSPMACIKSLFDTLSAAPKIKKISVLERVSSTLAEKVTLAVIGVNKSGNIDDELIRKALEKGVSREEIDVLLAGELRQISEDEIPAIMYAQVWAYKNGDVSKELRKKVIKCYGETGAFHIETIIKRVHFSTLCSNTVRVVASNWKKGKRDLKSSVSYVICLPIEKISMRKLV